MKIKKKTNILIPLNSQDNFKSLKFRILFWMKKLKKEKDNIKIHKIFFYRKSPH